MKELNFAKMGLVMKAVNVKTSKSTREIRKILTEANMDFESVVNKALNNYLPKIFLICPFTDELCVHKKQCMNCKSSYSGKLQ